MCQRLCFGLLDQNVPARQNCRYTKRSVHRRELLLVIRVTNRAYGSSNNTHMTAFLRVLQRTQKNMEVQHGQSFIYRQGIMFPNIPASMKKEQHGRIGGPDTAATQQKLKQL